MGLGFMNGSNDQEVVYDIQTTAPPQRRGNSTDIWKILKGIGGIIATLVLLGGLVWGSAVMFAGMASDEDLDKVEDRIELVEKHDIRQTIILEQIQETLKKISEKLDKVLE